MRYIMKISVTASVASTPHITYLFFYLSKLISFSKRLLWNKSLCIERRFCKVEFSSLWDCYFKLYFMSIACSSHSRPSYLASSKVFLFCSNYRSYFENPPKLSSRSSSPAPSFFLSLSYYIFLTSFLTLSKEDLCCWT